MSQGNDRHERSCMCDELGGSCVVTDQSFHGPLVLLIFALF